jgi:hypothetical protein
MNAATFLIQKLAIGVTFALEWLNEFQFQVSDLDESLPDAYVLLLPAVPILGVRTVGPLDEPERTDAEQRREQTRGALQILHYDANLHGIIQFHLRATHQRAW